MRPSPSVDALARRDSDTTGSCSVRCVASDARSTPPPGLLQRPFTHANSFRCLRFPPVSRGQSIKGSRRGKLIFWLQMACSRPESSPCHKARLRYLAAVRAIFAQKLCFPLGPPFMDSHLGRTISAALLTGHLPWAYHSRHGPPLQPPRHWICPAASQRRGGGIGRHWGLKSVPLEGSKTKMEAIIGTENDVQSPLETVSRQKGRQVEWTW